ncbi:hypothetical protein GH714_034539 [Hevea brasiliensis]|uniref:Peptidase S8/S53 domain-containing protein n=1 Tax=Hevea brasiliensis TaxID=3981 RepID=A0A6A6LT12_HEVBR|nr:hypothetical protein GH714_034539 [Hevea brasiliensis]
MGKGSEGSVVKRCPGELKSRHLAWSELPQTRTHALRLAERELTNAFIIHVALWQILLKYYNSSLKRDEFTRKITRFGAVASISGGLKANYSSSAPVIMYYSARGPDPEDSLLDYADILKPNLVAPGNFIWAAWSSLGTESVEFQGENFAMMSGTSMAAPHVAGLAALIKQKFPSFSPSAVASALSTTASVNDMNGGPIMAQRAYAPRAKSVSSNAIRYGQWFCYDDYMLFLCGINGSGPVIFNYTGQNCGTYNSTINGADLNLPSVTIANLDQCRTVQRTVINIAGNETYSASWSAPYGVSVKVVPTHFSIASGEKQVLNIIFNATMNSSTASFGRIGLLGNQGHVINIPLAVILKISYNTTNG